MPQSRARDHKRDLVGALMSEEVLADISNWTPFGTPIKRKRTPSPPSSTHKRFKLDESIANRKGAFHAFNSAALTGRTRTRISTRPILQTLVSNHHSDIYRCHQTDGPALCPVYVCDYSQGSKRGECSRLAVGTEEGTIHVLDTSPRHPWDVEPPRETYQLHRNALFALQWSPDDTKIAAGGGDHISTVVCVETGRELYTLGQEGHKSSLRCIAWDPSHRDLIATGGRDGALCIWDLRAPRVGNDTLKAVLSIQKCHEPRAKLTTSVTSVLYPDGYPHGIVTSGSSNGILRYWDFRSPPRPARSRAMPKTILQSCKALKTEIAHSSLSDPTADGSRRPRGIISVSSGTGPTAGLLFALGMDSRIHVYSTSGLPVDQDALTDSNVLLSFRRQYDDEVAEPCQSKAGTPSLAPLQTNFTHPNLVTSSFHLGTSVSPCGRWLASGCSGSQGRILLFDIARAGTHHFMAPPAVELVGQWGEVGSMDWATDGQIATCSDDGTVMVWRQNQDAALLRTSDPKEYERNWLPV